MAQPLRHLSTICGRPARMLALVAGLLAGSSLMVALGQAHPIFNGTENACTGALLDSGGEGASGYGNNENFTYTICPDQPGGAISLNFITFNLSTAGAAPVDFMSIYDGNSTGAPLLGTWTGTGLQGLIISASAANPSGCLTVVFRSNNTGTGVFVASITCYQPCERPTAVANNGPVQPLKICPGESVTFNSSASYAAPGFSIANRRWDFGDGTILNNAPAVVNHTYTQPGAYKAQLYLEDNNGCASTNLVDLMTFVGTRPTFDGVTGGSGCSAESICLSGSVTPTTWTELPDGNLGGGVFLPDNVGECFSTTLTFTHFAPGQTLTNANQLLGICVNMEHSYMGDLIIRIIGPTGQTVVLHQQGGNGTYLGIPVDNEATPNIQGVCWDYCWNAAATNGTWAQNGNGGTLPSGTYQSVQSLNGLLGSPLNGTWTLEVCDMWGIDNGFICDWSLDFDPALYPDLIQFTPVYGAQCDSSWWSGPNIVTTSGNCNQVCTSGLAVGNHPFTYTVTDDFGCTYDTTVTVTINPDLVVDAGPDAATCGTPVQLNATISGSTPVTECDYQLWLFDSYGDGWYFGGGYVTITVNGTSTSWTLNNGYAGYANITVPHGATISLTYYRGVIFANEQSFELLDSEGNVVYYGDNPPNGLVWTGTAHCPGGDLVFSWSPATGLSNPNIANPVANVSATTEYCVTVYEPGHPDCAVTDCMTITVDNPSDPGTNASHTVCGSAATFNLFNLLNGTPPSGGTWTGPNQEPSDGTFSPGTSVPGIYSYSVTSTGPCGNTTTVHTVTVTVVAPPDPGINGAITLCTSGAPASLFGALGGTPDAGGTWTGPSPVSGGMIDPATMAAGVYTYTVSGDAPCPDESATVTVTINTPPDPGTNGAITLCSSSASESLFDALGGTPDAGGTWTGPSTVSGGMIDPATMAAGVYTYTVSGDAPCPDESATVTVTINTPPDPGTNGAITLCSSSASESLFDALGGTPDAGGTWTGPSPVSGGMIDPATMAAGVYTYTASGVAPCPDESASITVTINTPPDPGTDGTLTLCSSGGGESLFDALGGTPDAGGTWTGPSTVSGGMIDPATMAAGVYTYTASGVAPCPDESATVTVTINTPPDPGTNGAITLCTSSASESLFDALGGTPDAGGTWTGPSPVSGGMIDPATMAASVYTYTVSGDAPCPDESATVTVTINTPPDPGTDGTLTLCSSGSAASLFDALGGTPDAGGTWTGPSTVSGGMIDPATMAAGVYTYTASGVAPCPDESATVTVTINTPPDPGTNGAITLCTSSASESLFDALGGTPDAGGTWTGPSPVSGGMIDPAAMAAGVYTYTVSGDAPCPDESASVTVTINTPPDPGTDGTLTLCSSGGGESLFDALGGTPDAGGTWTGPSTVSGGMIDPATMAAGVYTYTASGVAPCPDESATVTVTINTPPDPGTNGAITLCSSSASESLFDALGGTPDVGGTWTGPSPVSGGMIDPATMAAGVYTYTVSGDAPCPDESASITVTINTPPDPGTDGTLTLCSSGGAESLFDALGGTPDAGGTWTGPSTVSGGMIDPATMAAGVYTYTASGVAPCPDESATVTVTINTPPDPGTNGAITLCSSSASESLFDALGGTPDAGGTWTGPSPVSGGMIDPATMAAGVYTYTVSGDAPCPDESASITVTINTPPDPGTDGTLTLCSSGGGESLFDALGGTPDAGGTWTGPSTVSGGMIDPATMAAGVYTYTASGVAPCPDESATVTVTINTPPDPGTNGAITLCSSSASESLFDALGGTPDAGGTWTGPSPVSGGMIDPATMAAGVYTYTVSGDAPCPDESASITVTINAMPDAGMDGGLTLCSSSPATQLTTGLNGSPDAGGTWSSPSGGASDGSFTPGVNATGTYTYTVTGIAPCPDVSATVQVDVVTNPDAGTPGSTTLCATDGPILLFSELGGTPDAGGTWTGPSAVSGGLYDPATMAAGVYTYTISVPPPCTNASSTVTITRIAPPDAGSNGSLTLCISSPATSLFDALGGTPQTGGTWSGPSTVAGGLFNPATMNDGDYIYTVQGTAPCPADQAVVSVTVVSAPDAGTPGNATLCATDGPIDLFAQLGGTPDAGGAWTGPSAVSGGLYDPVTMAPGVYTYTISVPPPCTNASSTVTITRIAPPDAGSNGSLTLCISSPATSLFDALGGTPQTGGTWSGPSSVAGGLFDPGTMNDGDYIYTVQGTAPCPADQAVVSVTVVSAPDAGTPGNATLCATDGPIDLFAQLGGTPDAGGAWTGPSAVSGGLYDPVTMAAGVYTYTISVPPPCTNASSTVTITRIAPPDAGSNGSLTLCISSPATSLFDALGGTPQTGGTWSGPSTVAGGLFNPATMNDGDYIYTVQGTAPCPADQAMVSVTVVDEPNAGQPGNITLCTSDTAIDLFNQLGGTPDAGGTWNGPSTVVNGQFDPGTMLAGTYTYTITVPPPCTNVSSTVEVSLQVPPDAGSNGVLTLCITGTPVSLFDALGGTPEAGGAWSGPSNADNGLFDPGTMTPGDYTYTIQGTSPCPADAATVSVSIVDIPNAGTDDELNLCTSGDPVDLFPALGGADTTGSWTGPNGSAFNGTFVPGSSTPGSYTYTVTGNPPCPSASAVLTINVVTDADAGGDGEIALCSSDNAVTLFNQLQGTPNTGGDWYLPNGTAFNGVLDPLVHPSGNYTYVIHVPLPCVNDTSQVVVGITPAVSAGTDTSIVLCNTNGVISLTAQLGGNPDEVGTWTGPNGPTSMAFNPAIDPSGDYTYLVLGTPPCPNASATVSITVNPMPNAGLDGSLSLCPEASPVNLFDVLNGDPDSGGSWTAPNGLPHGGGFDPATDAPGNYTYTVTGSAPCPNDQASATLAIHVVPVPNAGNDQVSCTYEGNLNATGTWATGSWGSTTPGAIIGDPGSPSTPVTVHAGGAYTFVWNTVSAEGCASSDSVTIVFTDPIIPEVTTTSTICFGSCDGEAVATATGSNVSNGGYHFNWPSGITGNGAHSTGYCAGEYVVTVLDTNNCSAAIGFTILQPPPLVIDEVVATNTLCPESCDGTIQVIDPEGVHFSLNGGMVQPSDLFGGLCAGTYTITMLDANGCSATTTAVIINPPPVVAGFSVHPDTLVMNSPVVELTNTSSSNAVQFEWNFGDGTTSNEVSPVHQFPMGVEDVYTICLTAFSVNGCPDTYCVPLPVVGMPGIFIPNAFTPDGDGRNDVFNVVGTQISPEDFELLIFDRWGEKIFVGTDPDDAWDGTRNGREALNDVYVWKLRFHFKGSIESQELVGHVTLVR